MIFSLFSIQTHTSDNKLSYSYAESNRGVRPYGKANGLPLLDGLANDSETKLQSQIELMKKVQNEIDALPGITFEEAFEATYVIGKCPLKAEMLFRKKTYRAVHKMCIPASSEVKLADKILLDQDFASWLLTEG
ncbi:hypothetical protein Tco_1180565 [Tanacetum coccineum]